MKLNLGSGTKPKAGFINVDVLPFDGKVDVICNCGVDIWPWEDNSVEEIFCSHMIEHLTATERIHFINEVYRVLVLGGKCLLIAPHWSNSLAYGDLTHKWPPVSESWFFYLAKEWRDANAPHSLYNNDLNFETAGNFSTNSTIKDKNEEFQQLAISHFKDSIFEIHAILTKK